METDGARHTEADDPTGGRVITHPRVEPHSHADVRESRRDAIIAIRSRRRYAASRREHHSERAHHGDGGSGLRDTVGFPPLDKAGGQPRDEC